VKLYLFRTHASVLTTFFVSMYLLHLPYSGDDLGTTVKIGSAKAKKGCTILIEPLIESELPIMVQLRPGEIKGSEHIVKVAGRGWPSRSNRNERGSLIVTVKVVKDKPVKRSR